MASYRYKFLGKQQLPSKMTEAEAIEHCRLSDEQLAAIPIVSRVDDDGNAKRGRPPLDLRLGYALQLMFLGLTGRLAGVTDSFPANMVKVLANQLGTDATAIATIKSIYRGKAGPQAEGSVERRLREQRTWARQTLGFEVFAPEIQRELTATLTMRARDAASQAELVTFAEEWLYERRIVLPGVSTLEDQANAAFRAIETLAMEVINGAVKPARQRAILKIMFDQGPSEDSTVLEWLKTSAGKHGVKNLEEVSSRVDYLKILGVADWNLTSLSQTRIQAFAQRVAHRPPSETSRRVLETQIVEVICFLKATLWELTDEAIFRMGRRTGDLVRMGAKRVQSKQASRSGIYRESVQSMLNLAQDADKTAEERIVEIVRVAREVLNMPRVSHADIVRETLVEQGERVATVLDTMDCLNIEGDESKKDLTLVEQLKKIRTEGLKELPKDWDVSGIEAAWRSLVDDEDRVKALKAFKACALLRIRKGLLGGRLWVPHSANFRSRTDSLIPEEEWERDREKFCTAFGLEVDPQVAIARQMALLIDGLQRVKEGLANGLLEIDEQACVRLPALNAMAEEPELKRTAQAVQQMIGPVQLPDLILEMDAQTRFSSKLLGCDAKTTRELIALYAALLAHGTEIDAKSAAAMVSGVTVAEVTATMRQLETPGRLRAANNAVVAYQQSIPIVKLWSDGTKASADMMAMDTTRHLGIARTDPRRKTPAAGIYTHVLGSYPVFYDQPIVLLTRQGGPAVEGVEQYNSSSEERIKIQLLAVDTHGYTYGAMALAKHLRFDLCPQLAGLPDCKLWVTRKTEVPEELDAIALTNVSERAIVRGWDVMLRLVASILTGRVSVGWALARNGSAAIGDKLHRALDHYGRMLRSVYLCDYFTKEQFRREIHTLLNRGESVHQLQRAVYYGRIAAERGRRRDELRAISGSHVLLTNLIIAWNTNKLNEVVAKLRSAGGGVNDDIVRRLGPVFFGNINFRGIMSFSIEKYAGVLLSKMEEETPAEARRRKLRRLPQMS
ncbi:Tn3 family transposase [Hydrogenophaga sp.]|uniref:Tn3 family transposase n=1 Tax=Hydrogenophaga sp. TaxID=1904254 RepID=UPI002633CFBA|nr:Tn3 family transposase [Hydrogenophaga sp.]